MLHCQMAEVGAFTSGITMKSENYHLEGREQTVSINCVVLLGSALSWFSVSVLNNQILNFAMFITR